MMIQKQNQRFYLMIKGVKIKMLPEKYKDCSAKEIVSALDDSTKLRLTPKERSALVYQAFLQDLKSTEKYLYELISNSKPIEAIDVHVKNGENRKELRFENGYRVKINQELFEQFENKTTMNCYQ